MKVNTSNCAVLFPLVTMLVGVFVGWMLHGMNSISHGNNTAVGQSSAAVSTKTADEPAGLQTKGDIESQSKIAIQQLANANEAESISRMFADLPSWKKALCLNDVYRIEAEQGQQSLQDWLVSLNPIDPLLIGLILDQALSSSPNTRLDYQWLAEWLKSSSKIDNEPIADYSSAFLDKLFTAWLAREPIQAAAWFKQQPAWLQDFHAELLINRWAANDSVAASQWLLNSLQGSAFDHGVLGLVESADIPLDKRSNWADSVKNEGIKNQILKHFELLDFAQAQRLSVENKPQ